MPKPVWVLAPRPRVAPTAFVREVVLPSGPDRVPVLNEAHCRFALAFGPSRVHRWGVFAEQAIPARRRVIEYTGERIDRREAHRRRVRPHAYFFATGPSRAIDGAIGGSGAEFINHSCEPNLLARVRDGRVFYVSRRRIAPGEELLVDYNMRSEKLRTPCRCGSAQCRGAMERAMETTEGLAREAHGGSSLDLSSPNCCLLRT